MQRIPDIESTPPGLVKVYITSVGHGHGGIPDGDTLVLDMRKFRNVPEDETTRQALINGTGLDQHVQDYVLNTEGVRDFLDEAIDDLTALVDARDQRPVERRRLIDVVVECTGGRHRSVTGAEYILAALLGRGINSELEHRDINKGVLR